MDENCKDCLLVKAIDERVEKIECKSIDNANRIGVLEKAVAVSDEKFKQVFEKLDKIILILDKQADRIPSMVWGIAGAVLTGVIMWAFKF